jgi:hypothetical protein
MTESMIELGDSVSRAQGSSHGGLGDLVPWLALAFACTVGIAMTLFWIGRLVA